MQDLSHLTSVVIASTGPADYSLLGKRMGTCGGGGGGVEDGGGPPRGGHRLTLMHSTGLRLTAVLFERSWHRSILYNRSHSEFIAVSLFCLLTMNASRL